MLGGLQYSQICTNALWMPRRGTGLRLQGSYLPFFAVANCCREWFEQMSGVFLRCLVSGDSGGFSTMLAKVRHRNRAPYECGAPPVLQGTTDGQGRNVVLFVDDARSENALCGIQRIHSRAAAVHDHRGHAGCSSERYPPEPLVGNGSGTLTSRVPTIRGYPRRFRRKPPAANASKPAPASAIGAGSGAAFGGR